MTRSSNKRKGVGRKTYAILVDGETEKWYLDKLRSYENPSGIIIKPDLPSKKSLQEQFEAVKQNALVYDVSIWIVDLDVVLSEKQENTFNNYLSEISGNKSLQQRIYVLVNTPSLEFWFLLHVEDTGKYYPDCASVIAALRKHHPLKDYTKSEKYFIRSNPDIYARLRPYLLDALRFSRKRGHYDPLNPKKGIAELYRLFELLGLDKEKTKQ
ncbi:RloB family protein [Chitinophaga sp. CB10]|uniref:RloB family protein n=1 Tax=Chitinophaga sp. CB10 TaxID=1891659 RepID=UPI0025C6AA6D|nr:RloB family protein [Chitinophaga sp. CB10]